MKALVCGAGIAGLAVAHRLAATGWDVVVAERAPCPRTQGYMIDFFGPGYDAAEAMGVLPRLRELGYDVERMGYYDARGRQRAGLDYSRFATVVNDRLFSIMRPDLERGLREQLGAGVELRYGAGVVAVENVGDGVRVRLCDGGTQDADLLVGADGIHSTVRRLVFGPEERYLRYLGLHTAAYVFADPAVHRDVADGFCLTESTDRQMGFYGLRDGTVATFAVHRAADPALPADTREAIRRAYAGLGWVTPRALAACPEPAAVYYDQVAQVELPSWYAGRVVLVGDACQAVSLLAGQGASLAIAAAYVLGTELAAVHAGGSVADALARYQRRWQPVIAEKQAVARRGIEWFLPSSRSRLRLRRLALAAMRAPGLDRLLGTALVGKSAVPIGDLAGGPAAEVAAARG